MKTFVLLLTLPLFCIVSCQNRKTSRPDNATDTVTEYINYTSELKSDLIPDSVFHMLNLRRLKITGMECDVIELDSNGNDINECWNIREIPKDISKLKHLETLNLLMNAIETIPPEIKELKSLTTLDLSGNANLKNIDNITSLDSLEYLYLYECVSLDSLPTDIENLKNLKIIALTGTEINQRQIEWLRTVLPKCEIK